MTLLWDLDRTTQEWIMRGCVMADLGGVEWPRMVHTPLSSWVIYPDDTVDCVYGGDGCAVPGSMVGY